MKQPLLMPLRNQLQFTGALFVFGVLIFIAYHPITDAGTLIDDKEMYISDPVMTKSDGWRTIWLQPFQNNNAWPYIPLTRTTFWLERQLWGLNLSVSHWINVAFHFVSALLLWLLLKYQRIRGAWVTGMCFALHPIHVQSVAWIVERKNVVSGIFFLLTLWGYFHFEKKRTNQWYWFTLGFYLCALLSKTSTIMLPFIFVLYRIWQRSVSFKSDIWRLLLFFFIAGGAAYARIWFELNSFGASNIENVRSFLERLLTAGHIPFFYISKIVFPYPLIFTYSKWHIDTSQVSFYFPVCSLIIVMGILVWKYRTWGDTVCLGVTTFGILLFPVMGFFNNAWTQFSFVSNHWAYLPSIPLLILLVQGIIKISDKLSAQRSIIRQGSIFVVWGILISILTGMTRDQVSIYKENKNLWQTTLSHNPKSWLAYGELGKIYREEKQYESSLQSSNHALELRKKLYRVYNNRANVYADLKQYNQAIQDYNQALHIYPGFVEAYYNRGTAYLHLEQYQQALKDFNKALNLRADYSDAFFNRGNVYFNLEQYQQALKDYNKVLSINPNHTDAHFNRGTTYLRLGQYRQALEDYNTMLRFQPNHVDTHFNRGDIYFNLEQYQQALENYSEVLRLRPSHLDAYFHRGNTYFSLNQYQQALEDYSEVLHLQPNHADAYFHRGNTYFGMRQYGLALKDYDKGLQITSNNAKAYFNRGIIYVNLNQINLAIQDFSRALEIDPNYTEAYNKRGLSYKMKNNINLACSDWKKACNQGQCQHYIGAQSQNYCP